MGPGRREPKEAQEAQPAQEAQRAPERRGRRDGRIRHALPPAQWPSAAEAAASRLFSPVIAGPMQLEQRTWVPAMVPWRAQDSGEVTVELIEWYGRFAEGRPGAIVVEATGIRDVPSGPLLRCGHDRFIDGLARIADVVHARSGGHTRLLIQLIDFLAVKRRPPADKFFARFFEPNDGHRARLSTRSGDACWATASDQDLVDAIAQLDDAGHDAVLTSGEREALRFGYRERVTDMHLPHVRALPALLPSLFAAAAERAERAGFDGVELHFAHAYTMASFLSRTNDRDDGYGGDRAARARLPLEVFAACRAALADRTALGCRFLADEVIDGGSRIEDAVDYAVRFARAGMDFLSISKGGKFDDAKQPRVGDAVYPYTGPSGHECMPTVWSDSRGPFGRNLPLAATIRAAVRDAGFETPIIAAGGVNTFELAEAALARGDADIIASARQSLADPDWFAKVHAGEGGLVRRCGMTNYCEGLDQRHKQVTCQLWDRDFDAGGIGLRSRDGKRRLVAPPRSAPKRDGVHST